MSFCHFSFKLYTNIQCNKLNMQLIPRVQNNLSPISRLHTKFIQKWSRCRCSYVDLFRKQIKVNLNWSKLHFRYLHKYQAEYQGTLLLYNQRKPNCLWGLNERLNTHKTIMSCVHRESSLHNTVKSVCKLFLLLRVEFKRFVILRIWI